MTSLKHVAVGTLAALALAASGCSAKVQPAGLGQSQTPGIVVSPPDAHIAPFGHVSYHATVTGLTSAGVSWSVAEGGGGSIDSLTGNYTAPGSTGLFHVVATSTLDPTVSGTGTVSVDPPTTIIPPDRRTTWNPGIPGGRPNYATVYLPSGDPYGGYSVDPALGDNSTSARTAIQNALTAAGTAAGDGTGRVVLLKGGTGDSAGTYYVNGDLSIPSRVVLRGEGAGTGGGAGFRTKLRFGDTSISIGSVGYESAINVTADVPKEAETITVANGSSFAVGDIGMLDQADDPAEIPHAWLNASYIRGPGGTNWGPASTSNRHKGQMFRVIEKPSANVLRVYNAATGEGAPTHSTYTTAQAAQVVRWTNTTRYAGVENLYMTGFANAGVGLYGAAFCWVHGVELDGSVAGTTYTDGHVGTGSGGHDDHVGVMASYRCEVSHSYIHDSTNGGTQGGGSYGLVVWVHTADSLFEDNICWFMNKPLVTRSTGGGNVIAYNYTDDAKTGGFDHAWDYFQETTLDPCHGAYPHMDLIEGNYAPQLAADNVWGTSAYLTYFRNHCTGLQRRNSVHAESGSQGAINLQWESSWYLNAIGNVLGVPGNSPPGGALAYQNTTQDGVRALWRIGSNYMNPVDPGGGNSTDWDPNPFAATGHVSSPGVVIRAANYDFVRNQIDADPGVTLPVSLYLTSKPAFFGSYSWPWVNPEGATDAERVKTLPAKARFDAGTPNG